MCVWGGGAGALPLTARAPQAVRNFVQLCLEGYYDGCTFFRLIKDLFAQTGDPTGTGNGALPRPTHHHHPLGGTPLTCRALSGGESIYGAPFPDEFHSRLRFTHRGLVAMANDSAKNTNGSQFFITLAECEWLNSKHTIFARITGDTIYNVLAMNELETNGEVPVYPPKILGTQVLHSPFDDIVPRSIAPRKAEKPKKSDRKKLRKKNTSLLSFGEEADKEETELDTVLASDSSSRGVVSSHDLLVDDETLLKDAADEVVHSRLRDTIDANEREDSRRAAAKQKLKDATSAVGSSWLPLASLASRLWSDQAGCSQAATRGVDDDVDEAFAESDEEAAVEAQQRRPDEGSSLSFDEQMRQKLKQKQAALAGSGPGDEQARSARRRPFGGPPMATYRATALAE